MHISLDWLKDFVNIKKDLDPKDLGNLLTLKTAEVETVIEESRNFENMVTGKVIDLKKHPDADKLKIAKTSIGKETLQIVCGGQNLKEGMCVAVAKIGAKIKWHGKGDLVEMKKAKIRGVESSGMICAGEEIGIEDPDAGEHDILDLSAIKPKPGTPLAEFFKKDDVILEFDNKSLTHRPDLWGHHGIAREVAVITNSKFKELKTEVKIPKKGESVKVDVKDTKLCPRYCGLIINNIKVQGSPHWIQKRLKATGHGLHNNIVDVTNYVMIELGQPMHAFDKNYIKNGIVVRKAKKGEKIKSLDEKENTLTENMLLIADHEKPVAIAGIIGGENSGINEKTTSIILESANFNAANVRRTSTKLGIRTDSSQRFEKSLDPNLAETAIKRAAEIILEICPEAKIAGPITDIENFDKKALKVKFDTEKAASKIGVAITQKEIIKILEKLHFEVKVKDETTLEVTIPSFRATKDIDMEDDLIEEIARIYGYENIAAILPSLPTKLPKENTERFKKHKLRELLSLGHGFTEVYNYSFYGQKELKNSLMTEEGHIKLLNYLSEDQTHMRTSLIPNLLKNIHENFKFYNSFKIYEIGRTYKEIGQYFPLEEKNVVGAITTKEKTDDVFYEAKKVVETIFQKFNIKAPKPSKGIKNAPYAHPTKSMSYIDHNGQTIAKIFTLHPSVAKNHEIEKYSVTIFNINFTELLKLSQKDKKYKKIAKFPSIEIDISVVINERTEMTEIEQAIKKADQNLIQNITLFDLYQGEHIDPGKKAIAFKITLQATDRTLTDQEMAEVQKKIFKNLENIGGIIRGK